MSETIAKVAAGASSSSPEEHGPLPAAPVRSVPARARPGRSGPLATLIVGLMVVWAWGSSAPDFGRLVDSGPRIAEFLGRLWPPDPTVLPIVVKASVETLHIAVLGTAFSIVLSIVLGVLAAETITPAWLHTPIKSLLAAIRGVPLILVAMLMVGAVGLGPTGGILAIAIHSTGMLGKFYAEAFENVAASSMSAMDSVGASRLQALRFGAWPQVAPDLVRDTLFRFELNLRESLVLGLVGAGGVGFYIQTYIRAFQYQKVATLTLVILVFVLLIEGANQLIRRGLR